MRICAIDSKGLSREEDHKPLETYTGAGSLIKELIQDDETDSLIQVIDFQTLTQMCMTSPCEVTASV